MVSEVVSIPVRPPAGIELVVIGASAGAVDALSIVLPGLPPSFARPILVIVHLPSRAKSLLASLFAGKCALKTQEVEDKQRLESGTIYFAPPDYHVLVENEGYLSLDADEPVNFSRPSIDVSFQSAAEAYGAAVLGILLTGASRDGALGLLAIHRNGGFTVVQDPTTAAAAIMPEAAVACFAPDAILELPGILELLRELPRKEAPA